jgi:hypothetical protein
MYIYICLIIYNFILCFRNMLVKASTAQTFDVRRLAYLPTPHLKKTEKKKTRERDAAAKGRNRNKRSSGSGKSSAQRGARSSARGRLPQMKRAWTMH